MQKGLSYHDVIMDQPVPILDHQLYSETQTVQQWDYRAITFDGRGQEIESNPICPYHVHISSYLVMEKGTQSHNFCYNVDQYKIFHTTQQWQSQNLV